MKDDGRPEICIFKTVVEAGGFTAAFWFIALERCCQQQLIVKATGIKPVLVPERTARYSHDHVGSEYIGWLHFQPVVEQFKQDSPNMFD